MKKIKSQLEVEIEGLKKSMIMSNSQVVDGLNMKVSSMNRTGEKNKLNHSFNRPK
jgi:hypothetical protein